MIVEIVEFYPIQKNEDKETLTGTLRIKIPDLGIHILGIFVSNRKDYWHFSLPSRQGIHHETGKPVRYPLVLFEDRDKQRELIDAVRGKGRAFIEHRLSDIGKPLIFPQKQQNGLKQPETPKAQDKLAEPKEAATIAKPKPKVKEFYDLPPRSAKPTARFMSKFAQR